MANNRTCLGISILLFVVLLIFIPLVSAEDSTVPLDDKQGTMNLSIERMEKPVPLTTIGLMAGMSIILLIIIYFLIKYIRTDQKKEKAIKEKVRSMDKDEAEYFLDNQEEDIPTTNSNDDIDKFLKDDELAIVNILRQREGICSQSTLRVIGNFSKATLSRLLSELEERNILKKEKRGKKNLVILR